MLFNSSSSSLDSFTPKIVSLPPKKEKEEISIKENIEEVIFSDNYSSLSDNGEKRKSKKAALLKTRFIKILWEFLTQLSLTIVFSMKV